MRSQRESNSKLFLTELMISIFFFAVITALCVQLFTDAHLLSRQSEKLTNAVKMASDAAEYYSGWDFKQESWQEVFPLGYWEGNTWKLFFDQDGLPCAKNGQYLLEMQLQENENLSEAHIVIKDEQEKEIYTLITKRVSGKQ